MDNIKEFQEFVSIHTWRDKDIYFTSNAFAAEVGEVLNILKKFEAYKDFPNYRKQIDEREKDGAPTLRERFVDESGDALFYFMQMLNKQGVSVEEVVAEQVKKINKQSESVGRCYLK